MKKNKQTKNNITLADNFIEFNNLADGSINMSTLNKSNFMKNFSFDHYNQQLKDSKSEKSPSLNAPISLNALNTSEQEDRLKFAVEQEREELSKILESSKQKPKEVEKETLNNKEDIHEKLRNLNLKEEDSSKNKIDDLKTLLNSSEMKSNEGAAKLTNEFESFEDSSILIEDDIVDLQSDDGLGLSLDDEDLDFGIKDEIKEDLDFGIQDEIKEDLDFGIQDEIKEDLNFGIQDEIKEDLDFGIQDEIKEDLDFGIQDEIKEDDFINPDFDEEIVFDEPNDSLNILEEAGEFDNTLGFQDFFSIDEECEKEFIDNIKFDRYKYLYDYLEENQIKIEKVESNLVEFLAKYEEEEYCKYNMIDSEIMLLNNAVIKMLYKNADKMISSNVFEARKLMESICITSVDNKYTNNAVKTLIKLYQEENNEYEIERILNDVCNKEENILMHLYEN